jgi:hypothetical protein
MFSSFENEIVRELVNCRGSLKYSVCSLFNNNQLAEVDYRAQEGVSGINISEKFLSQELVDLTHKDGKTIGVWFGAASCKED